MFASIPDNENLHLPPVPAIILLEVSSVCLPFSLPLDGNSEQLIRKSHSIGHYYLLLVTYSSNNSRRDLL